MGGYTIPVATSQDPNDPNNPNPYAIYGYNGYGGMSAYNGADSSSQDWGTAINQGGQDVSPDASISQITSSNRNQISTTGNELEQQGANELNYYAPLQQDYTGAENEALNQLDQQPGYTPDQAGQIDVDYSQFNTSPDQWQDINNTLNTGTGNEGATLNAYQSQLGSTLGSYGQDLSGQLSNYQSWLGDQNQQYQSGVGGVLQSGSQDVDQSVSALGTGLQAAQSDFSGLNQAVSNPALNFDPNQTEQQLTPEQQQAIVTAAGTTVGNQFQSAEDQLRQSAAAQGNTSPEALAAMQQQLTTQAAETAGNTMTQAGIEAEQAGFQQAQAIEAQREGAVQTQAGLQATASTTEEAAAQAAAAQAGETGVSAQQYLTGEGLSGQEAIGANTLAATEQSGQAGLSTEENYGGQQLSSLEQYYPAAVSEQNTITGQNLGQANLQANTQYAQGTGSQQLTSAGATNVGQTAISGMNNYRSGVAGQEAQAQQGGATAQQTELGAYGTQTSGINSATSTQSNYAVGKPSFGDDLTGLLAGKIAKGGIVTEPGNYWVGEEGPEAVIPLKREAGSGGLGRYSPYSPYSPYRSNRNRSNLDSLGKVA